MSFNDSKEVARVTKRELVSKFKKHGTDTGSPEVQVALLTKRIETLANHFKTNKQDNHSRRGMLKLISQRKGLLEYLKRESVDRYKTTLNSLGLRK